MTGPGRDRPQVSAEPIRTVSSDPYARPGCTKTPESSRWHGGRRSARGHGRGGAHLRGVGQGHRPAENAIHRLRPGL